MIRKTIGFRGTLFSDTPILSMFQRNPLENVCFCEMGTLGKSQLREAFRKNIWSLEFLVVFLKTLEEESKLQMVAGCYVIQAS